MGPLPPATTLARSLADLTPLLGAIALLIVLAVAGGAVLLVLRRRLLGTPPDRANVGGLMDELRAMHARGDLTDEEFAAARRRVIERLTGPSTTENKPGAPKDPA